MIEENDYAYAAGLIDGEGCIYIHKYNSPKESKNPWYSLRVSVGMTNFDVINYLKDTFGGNVSYSKGNKKNRTRNQARWIISSKDATIFLKKIKKYLICKYKEAELGIKFGELPSANKWKETPVWLLEKREDIYLKLREIKTKEFKIPLFCKKKHFKKDEFFNCPICGKKTCLFNKNGTKKKTCSVKCSKRRFNNEQEIEIIRYKEERHSYKNIMEKYSIAKGTLIDILKRKKEYNI